MVLFGLRVKVTQALWTSCWNCCEELAETTSSLIRGGAEEGSGGGGGRVAISASGESIDSLPLPMSASGLRGASAEWADPCVADRTTTGVVCVVLPLLLSSSSCGEILRVLCAASCGGGASSVLPTPTSAELLTSSTCCFSTKMTSLCEVADE